MKFCTMSSSENPRLAKKLAGWGKWLRVTVVVSGDEEEEKWGIDVNLKFWVKLLVHSYQDQQEFSSVQIQLQHC